MSRLSRNSIAAESTTLLITTGMSFAANGATGETFIGHAEAPFLSAGDAALGAFLETVADQIEGVEVTCQPGTAAADCTKTRASDGLVALPISDATGVNLRAANNYASGNAANGSSTAASGAVTDSSTINTDAPRAFPPTLLSTSTTEPSTRLPTSLPIPS